MAYTPGNPGTKLDKNFENDLLAIADTKLVLGNWYAECTMNGRSLPDFAAILGMCTANYGHTRAIYQYLAAHGHDYDYLERGRGPEDICSSNLLDEAPAGWEDFIVSTWLAELSTWMLASGDEGASWMVTPGRNASPTVLAEGVGGGADSSTAIARGPIRL